MLKNISLIITVFFLASASLSAEITVLRVKGNVAYKTGRDWNQLSTGQTLPEGVKISTGANSSAELKLNALNHKITVKPFTVIQVFSSTDSKASNTDVGLKRGNIVVKVPKDKKVKTIFKVTTPIATSSVRGTEEDIFYGARTGMIIRVLEGEIAGSNRIDRTKYIRGRQIFVQRPGEPDSDSIVGRMRNRSIANVRGHGTGGDENNSGIIDNDRLRDDASLFDYQKGAPGEVDSTVIWP